MCSPGPYNYSKADSYALGKTLYEMASLCLYDSLYSDFYDPEEYCKYLSSKLSDTGEHFQRAILGLMALNAEERWTCAQACQYLSRLQPKNRVVTPPGLQLTCTEEHSEPAQPQKEYHHEILNESTQSQNEEASDQEVLSEPRYEELTGHEICPFEDLGMNQVSVTELF